VPVSTNKQLLYFYIFSWTIFFIYHLWFSLYFELILDF